MNLGIIGAGFVGLTFAAVLASKGYNTTLMDSNLDKINIDLSLNIGEERVNSWLSSITKILKNARIWYLQNNSIMLIPK